MERTMNRIFLTILAMIIAFSLCGNPVAEPDWVDSATMQRLQLRADSLIATGWNPVEAEDFPWRPRQFVAGWQRQCSDGLSAGLFAAFQSPADKLLEFEYAERMYAVLHEDFNASVGIVEAGSFGQYRLEQMTFHADSGNGLFFEGADTPTTLVMIVIHLDDIHGDSPGHPLVLLYGAAPTECFAMLETGIQLLLQSIYIRPARAGTPSEPVDPDSLPAFSLDSIQSAIHLPQASASEGLPAEATGWKPNSTAWIVGVHKSPGGHILLHWGYRWEDVSMMITAGGTGSDIQDDATWQGKSGLGFGVRLFRFDAPGYLSLEATGTASFGTGQTPLWNTALGLYLHWYPYRNIRLWGGGGVILSSTRGEGQRWEVDAPVRDGQPAVGITLEY